MRMMKWASTALLPQLLNMAAGFGCRGLRLITASSWSLTNWSLVGSANWDPRSLRLNFEFNVEAYDIDLAAPDDDRPVEDRQLNPCHVRLRNRPLVYRLRDGFARLASPYL